MVNTQEPVIRAAIYVRMSDDREGGGLGVDRQEEDCRELAAKRGWTVVDVYADNDLSASSGKPRPRYRDMLNDLKSKRVNAVVAWHTDRLHRRPIELEEYIDVCELHAAPTDCVKAGALDLTTASGRMIARQLGVIARYEIEHMIERSTRKKLQIAQSGGDPGGPRPFGYRRRPKLEGGGLIIDLDETVGIRHAYNVILAGGSLRSVVGRFDQLGLRTSTTNEPWKISTLRKMLLSPRLAGLRQHKGKIIGDAAWEAIVTPEEYHAVVSILTDPRRRHDNHGHTPRWLGSGVYLCGICAGVLRVGTNGTPPRASYRCKGVYDRPTAGGIHISRGAKDLDEFMKRVLLEYLETPMYAAKFAPEPRPLVDVTDIRKRMTVQEEKARSVATKFGQDLISEAVFDVVMAETQSKIRELKSRLESAVMPTPVSDLVASGDVRGTWETYDLDRKRAVIREVVTVTVLPAEGKGRPFDPAFVRLDWKR